MNNNNNTVSKVLGFIAMAFGIISIPMLFLPLVSVDLYFFDVSGGNIIEMFSILGDEMILPILFIVMEVVALIGAVFIAIPKKILKILGCVFLSLAFVGSVAFIIVIFVNDLKPGMGLWILFVCLLVATILSIISAVKFKTVVTDEFEESGSGEYYDDGGNYKLPQGEISFYGGSCAGYNIPIPSGVEVLIGKDPAVCQVVIDKSYGKVSRKHCGVRYDSMSGMYMVTDYSSNGTFIVNGQRLASNQTSYLGAGTTLNLAKTDNTFRLG